MWFSICAPAPGQDDTPAELMRNEGRILACDIDAKRLTNVKELAARLGIGIIETQQLGSSEEAPAGPFDAVLVDVPCSQHRRSGRRPEARWRLKPEGHQPLDDSQSRLLRLAAGASEAGRGGRLTRRAASEPEENGELVRAILTEANRPRQLPGFSVEAEEERRPGQPGRRLLGAAASC